MQNFARAARDFVVEHGPSLLPIPVVLAVVEVLLRFFEVRESTFPLPSAVIQASIVGWQDNVAAVLITAPFGLMGYVCGALLGFLLGIAAADIRWVNTWTDPILTVLETIPKVVLAPIFVLLSIEGDIGRLTMAAVFVVFPVFYSTREGLRVTSGSAFEAEFKLYGLPYIRRLLFIRLPYATREITKGFGIAALLWLVGVIVLEFVYSNGGLGHRIVNTYASLNSTADAFATIVWICGLSYVVYSIVSFGNRWLIRKLGLDDSRDARR